MATLVAVLMKGLQTSRANIKRDTYQAEVNKRAINIGAKAEAYLFKYGNITGFSPDANDLADPVGETYAFAKAVPKSAGDPYTITLTPAKSGVLEGLGVEAEKYEFR
jgi:hypothetical protein